MIDISRDILNEYDKSTTVAPMLATLLYWWSRE
jgi:hypothetical protein